MLRLTTALTAALVLTSGVAHAVMLSTPLVGAGPGRILQCIVTNVGTKPATVSVKLYAASGDELALNSDSCAPSPIARHASCAVQPLPNQVASCVVTSSSKSVRAALEVFDGGDVVTAVPATAR